MAKRRGRAQQNLAGTMRRPRTTSTGRTTLGPQIAVRTADPYSLSQMWGRLRNPDLVLQRFGFQTPYQVYRQLYRDAHVIGELRAARAGLLDFEWRVEGRVDTRAGRRVLGLVERMFERWPAEHVGWPDLIWTIGSAVWTGYAPHEVIWQRESDGAILPSRILDVPVHRIIFRHADNEPRLITRQFQWDGEPLPAYRFLIPRHMPSYDNPYGVAVFSACIWPHLFKHEGFRFFSEFCERFGQPWPIAKFPAHQPEQAEPLADELAKIVRGGVSAVPDNVQVDLITAAGTTGPSPQERLIQACNTEISKAINSQTLATEIHGQGSRAASTVHHQREREVSTSDRILIESAFNCLFRWISDLNTGSDLHAPIFKFFDSDAARLAWATLFEKVHGYAAILSSDVYRHLGLTPPDGAAEVIPPSMTTPPGETEEMP